MRELHIRPGAIRDYAGFWPSFYYCLLFVYLLRDLSERL